MTINELISMLEDYRDEIGGDAEVRLMTQQNWPFENSIHGLVSGNQINEATNEDEGDDDLHERARRPGIDRPHEGRWFVGEA